MKPGRDMAEGCIAVVVLAFFAWLAGLGFQEMQDVQQRQRNARRAEAMQPRSTAASWALSPVNPAGLLRPRTAAPSAPARSPARSYRILRGYH